MRGCNIFEDEMIICYIITSVGERKAPSPQQEAKSWPSSLASFSLDLLCIPTACGSLINNMTMQLKNKNHEIKKRCHSNCL